MLDQHEARFPGGSSAPRACDAAALHGSAQVLFCCGGHGAGPGRHPAARLPGRSSCRVPLSWRAATAHQSILAADAPGRTKEIDETPVPRLLPSAACQGDPTLTLGADPRDLDGDQGQDDGPGAGDDGGNDGGDGGDGDDGDDGDDNDGCVSEVDSFGILCSTCPGRDRECIPADCTVQDSCLRCEDPAGREATDCSIDYDEVPIVQATLIADGAFNPCTMTWGDPTGSATTCRYPGFDDCVETDDEEGHCITCGTVRVCAAGPDDPLPDPFAERPDDLPPPSDGCSLIFSPDGEQNLRDVHARGRRRDPDLPPRANRDLRPGVGGRRGGLLRLPPG